MILHRQTTDTPRFVLSTAAWRVLVVVLTLLFGVSGSRGEAGDRAALPVGRGPVIVVLDASGSMAAKLGRETRLDAARRILLDTLSLFPIDRPVGLVAYGHRRKSDCRDIETIRGLAPVDLAAIRQALEPLRAKGKTPLSGALRHAAGLLPAGGGTIMLVSDGLETCREDPCAVAEALKKAQAGLVIHVVGFGLSEGEMKRLSCIAERGGGQAIETRNAEGLERALKTLTQPPQAADTGSDARPAPTEPVREPSASPPPTRKPVLLRGVVGKKTVPGAVLFTVVDAKGETVYSGKGTEVSPSLAPGRYRLHLAGSNIDMETALTVAGQPDERHEIPLKGGLVRLSVVAAPGLSLADTDLKGDPTWTLAPRAGQAPATLEGVLAPEAMLAPGSYTATVSLGGFSATTDINVREGNTVESVLDLQLGKLTLEAALPGETTPIETGAGLSWTLAGQADTAPLTAEALARPTFLVSAGAYTARLAIAGAVIEQAVTAEAGATKTVRLDLPSAELVLEGSLGPDAPSFTDWRDATWTVRPVQLIGNAQAGAALENKAEALPHLTLLPGDWAVTLTSGAASVTRRLTLAPGAKARERLDVGAARLSISAMPEPGAPAPLNVVISIFATTTEGGFAEKPVAEAGTSRDYAIILPAGRYRINAADEQGRKGAATIDLPEGQSLEMRIALK
ncbi:vWA domain-containing protein [Rhizobium sp. YIM 134829]|uniref:vWA domain-containing protein n=1 Tax=Rhizobium sp. YIM 134829 TaxID=3390453 RepID=UPI00397A4132